VPCEQAPLRRAASDTRLAGTMLFETVGYTTLDRALLRWLVDGTTPT
jgi:hypothetical protein